MQVGDKAPGKRLGKFYAHVQAIHDDCVELLYNGDVKNHRISFDVIDAMQREIIELPPDPYTLIMALSRIVPAPMTDDVT